MPDHPSQRYISPLWSLRSFPGYTYIHAYIHATETASARPESLTGSTRFATECATVEAPLPMHVAPPVLAGDRPPKGGGRAVRGMRPTCYTPCGPHATRPCSAAHFCLLHAAPPTSLRAHLMLLYRMCRPTSTRHLPPSPPPRSCKCSRTILHHCTTAPRVSTSPMDNPSRISNPISLNSSAMSWLTGVEMPSAPSGSSASGPPPASVSPLGWHA